MLLAIASTLNALQLIIQHLFHYNSSRLQRPVTRILALVPVYALASLASVLYYPGAVYVLALRDAYEGFVVASFFTLMCQYVGPTEDAQREVLLKKVSGASYPPPACCWKNDPTRRHFLSWSKLGVLQYVVVRVSTTLLAVVLQYQGIYCPESMDPRSGHFWTTLLNGASMGVAMFTLITFYIAVHSDISQYKPVLQFFSVKFVIFFGFWQGFVVKLLLSQEWFFPEKETTEEDEIILQNLLTCLEMAIATLIHRKAFDYRVFLLRDEDPTLPQQDTLFSERENRSRSSPLSLNASPAMSFREAFWDSFYWLDLWNDLVFVSGFLKDRFKKGARYLMYWWQGTLVGRMDSSLTDIYQDAPLINESNLARFSSTGSFGWSQSSSVFEDSLDVGQELINFKDESEV